MKTRMHNGSRLLSLLLAVVLAFTLTVPALAADKPQDMNLRIAVMSDLHYFSPDMIADTADFEHALNSDRKLLKESSAILHEKFEQVRADKPDILLVSGDLTKDGEQECHAALAKQLQQLQQDIPGLKIYVINGNHDIRNYNAKNFNTADGKAVRATRTEPEDFKQIYDFVYSDPTVIATFTPAEGNKAGGLSYVARPVEGLTIIAMDTCRYSSDNTSNGDDEHETSGAISADLEKWVIEQTAAAKARGDLVIGLEHHGLVPHFDVEPTILPMYLVNGYERIAQEYADAGMSAVFTGHMHAVDIAAMTTKAGNTFYDIETGSALTYPCPIRFVDLRRSTVGGETSTYMSVSTKTHAGPINYTDPATGTAHVIDDLTEYAREFGFSTDMLKTVAGDFVKSFFGKYLPNDTWPVTKIVANIDQIIDDVAAVPIADGKDLLDFANWIYQCNLAGEDDGNYPAWVQSGVDQLKSGALLDQVLDIVARDAFGRGSVLFTSAIEYLTGWVLEKVFHDKWWDYSKRPLNIKGYVCLEFSVLWGLACVFVVDVFQPLVAKVVDLIPKKLGWVLLGTFSALWIADNIITAMEIRKLPKKLRALQAIEDSLTTISDEIGEEIYIRASDAKDRGMEVYTGMKEKSTELAQKRAEASIERREEILSHRNIVHERIAQAFPALRSGQTNGRAFTRVHEHAQRRKELTKAVKAKAKALKNKAKDRT